MPPSRRPHRVLRWVLIVCLVVVIVVFTEQWRSDSQTTSAPSWTVAASELDRAQTQLDELSVRGKAGSLSRYSRDKFGKAWADVDDNGCDTRNDVLFRDLNEIELADNDCTVLRGTLHDPYTGQTIAFNRGKTSSAAVQIDHVVPLADAWRNGASQWSNAVRREFANDAENLLAVDGSTNSAKGADNAATWLPPNEDFVCAYVVRQIAVKHEYQLTVTRDESAAMQTELTRCKVG